MVRHFTVTLATLLLSTAFLPGCSTVTDGASQDIRINIAGTGEALCDVTQPGRRYRVYAPSTMRVMRSGDDLRIRCKAPANREQVVILKSVVSDKFAYNALNLGVGAAWDRMTGAMYSYPDTILIDFSNMPASNYPQPDYQDVFDKYPDLMQMEQFRPGQPALGSDRGTSVPTMQLREGEEDNSMGIMMPVSRPGSGGSSSSGTSVSPSAPVSLTAPSAAAPAPGTTSSATGITPSGNARTFSNGAETTNLKPGSGDSGTTSSTNTSNNSAASKITSRPSAPATHIFSNKLGTLPSVNK